MRNADGRTESALPHGAGVGPKVYEIQLNDEFLMSSHFTEAEEQLARLAELLHPSGAFALWSNNPPDEAFLQNLASVFREAKTQAVAFLNPLQNRMATNTVYTVKRAISLLPSATSAPEKHRIPLVPSSRAVLYPPFSKGLHS